MSDAVKKAIEDMQQRLATKQAEVSQLKKTINGMAVAIGDEPIYQDETEEPQRRQVSGGTIRPDEFFGRSPITAAREFLERGGNQEPKTGQEILDALKAGGFDFAAQGWKADHQLKNLSISLGKNTAIFVRLPSGPYGLVKWYPELKQKKAKAAVESKTSTETPPDSQPDAEVPVSTDSPSAESEPN